MAWYKKKLNLNQNLTRQKVLVICMLDSIHTARWLEQFASKAIDFHLVPSTPNRIIHSKILELINNQDQQSANFKVHISNWKLPIIFWGIDLFFANRIRAFVVRRILKNQNISILHAMELNHAGYIAAKALNKKVTLNLKVISTVWGSDIFWFGKFSKHQKKLKKILAKTNLLISECKRDKPLAENLGFNGVFLESSTLFGFDLSEITKDRSFPSQRNLILVKGYESFVGRASIALSALVNIRQVLDNFQIYVYSANLKTLRLVKKINKQFDLNITCSKKRELSNPELLDLYSKARIHLGVSLSDGVPASVLESIITGAFPIQTNTACVENLIEDGKSGFLVNPEISEIERALEIAITNDELVDNAMTQNRETALAKLQKTKLLTEFDSIYL